MQSFLRGTKALSFALLLLVSAHTSATTPVVLVETARVVVSSQQTTALPADIAITLSPKTLELVNVFSKEPANKQTLKSLRTNNSIKQIVQLLRSKTNLTARLVLQFEKAETIWLKINHKDRKPKLLLDIRYPTSEEKLDLFIKRFADTLVHLTSLPRPTTRKKPATKSGLKDNRLALVGAGVAALVIAEGIRRCLPEKAKLRHKGNGFTVYGKKCPKQEGPFCMYHATVNALLVYQALKKHDTITLADVIKVDLTHTNPASMELIKRLYDVTEETKSIPNTMTVTRGLSFDILSGKKIVFLSPHATHAYHGLSDIGHKKYTLNERNTLIKAIKTGKTVVTPWYVGPREEKKSNGEQAAGHAVCRVFIPTMANGKITHLDVVHIDSGGGFFDIYGKNYDYEFDPYTFDEDLSNFAQECLE